MAGSVMEYPEPMAAVVSIADIANRWQMFQPFLVDLDMDEPIELVQASLLGGTRQLIEMQDQSAHTMSVAVVGKLGGDLVVFGLGKHGASYWIKEFARLLNDMAKADECEQVLVEVPPGWMGEMVQSGFVANRVCMNRVVRNGSI